MKVSAICFSYEFRQKKCTCQLIGKLNEWCQRKEVDELKATELANDFFLHHFSIQPKQALGVWAHVLVARQFGLWFPWKQWAVENQGTQGYVAKCLRGEVQSQQSTLLWVHLCITTEQYSVDEQIPTTSQRCSKPLLCNFCSVGYLHRVSGIREKAQSGI